MDDKFEITITIANVSHKIRINRSVEEIYPRAAKEVNLIFAQYKDRYAGNEKLSDAHFLSFVAFQFAVKFHTLSDSKDVDILNGKIEDLTREVEEYLRNK